MTIAKYVERGFVCLFKCIPNCIGNLLVREIVGNNWVVNYLSSPHTHVYQQPTINYITSILQFIGLF